MILFETLKDLQINRAIQNSICIALFAFFTCGIHAQEDQKNDSILIEEASMLLENESFIEAINKTKEAASQCIKNKNWLGLYDCQYILFSVEYSGIYPKTVLPIIEKNHASFSNVTGTEHARSSLLIAYIENYFRGNPIKALKIYDSTIEIFERLEDSKRLIEIYANLGTIYTKLGDYNTASKYINESKRICLQTNDIQNYGNNIYNLGDNSFYEGNYSESEKYYHQCLEVRPDYEEDIYFSLCGSKTAQGKTDSARIYFNKAKKLNSNGYYLKEDFNNLYSDILCKEGKIDSAIYFLKKNHTQILEYENIRDQGKYYYKMADLFFMQGNLDSAFQNFDLSLQSFTNNEISVDSIFKLEDNNFYFHEIWIADILIGLSKIYSANYKDVEDEEFRKKAIACINLAMYALDYKRNSFEDMGSSLFASKKSKILYETAIDIYLDWYEQGKQKKYLNSAFEIAQKHNSFILRQQVNERVILDKYEVDDSHKSLYLDQKLKVVENSYMLNNMFSQSGFEALKTEETKLDSITKIINNKYPLFQNAKNDFEVASVKEVQNNLKKNKAVIKYFEGSDKLYSFVITKNKLTYFVHKNLDEITEQTSKIRSILTNIETKFSLVDSLENEYLQKANRLYENILSNEIDFLPKKVKSIVIIPTGILTQIPFEPLVTKEKKSWKEPASYLIYDYAISYNYFCKALTSTSTNNELYKVLSYGLEYDEYTLNASKKITNDSISKEIIEKFRSEEMGHLYSADNEAIEVAEMFDGVSYTNKNATKANFLSNVSDNDIIHLSAHSFVDYQFPSNSSIIFSKKDSLTDNLLKIKDVDRLFLNGQLFTLSACNTFYGKKNEGEGLSSMARSFIQSGAGSVIGSFWSVPDEISKSFMVHFYSKLKAGMTKDEALQATKIDFMTDDILSSPLYRSPAYWSAWVVFGDTQSIYKPRNRLLYSGLGILAVIILFLFKKYWKRLQNTK